MYTYINIVHTYIYNTYLKLCNENFDRRSPLLLLLLFTRGLSVSTGEAKKEREREIVIKAPVISSHRPHRARER